MYIIHVNTVGLFKHAWEKNKNKKEGDLMLSQGREGVGTNLLFMQVYNAFGPGHESSNDP